MRASSDIEKLSTSGEDGPRAGVSIPRRVAVIMGS